MATFLQQNSFYIFMLLKYDRIFGKKMEHDTDGLK